LEAFELGARSEYISDRIECPYQPVNNNNFIVRGSERTGMYGINFLQVSTEPEEFVAYGWDHKLHTLGVSQAFERFGRTPANL